MTNLGKKIRYACSQCKTALESPESQIGNMDTCPVCQTQCRVPLPTIKYKCPTCSTRLESPGEMGGREDVCPNCGDKSTVPELPDQRAERQARLRRETDETMAKEKAREQLRLDDDRKRGEAKQKVDIAQRAMTTGEEKRCPFCAETIKAKAIKCKFCGSDLEEQFREQTQNPIPMASNDPEVAESPPKSVFSRFARGGLIGVVGGEKYCTSPEQMRLGIKGRPTAGKTARRLLFLMLLGISGFVTIVLICMAISANLPQSTDTSSSGPIAQPQPQPVQPQSPPKNDEAQLLARQKYDDETIRLKAEWVRSHGGTGSSFDDTDKNAARFYDNLSRASGEDPVGRNR